MTPADAWLALARDSRSAAASRLVQLGRAEERLRAATSATAREWAARQVAELRSEAERETREAERFERMAREWAREEAA